MLKRFQAFLRHKSVSKHFFGMATQLPEHFTIGTEKAFDNKLHYDNKKGQIRSETVYVCNKGSDWARKNELLVLLHRQGCWTALDSAVSADGSTLQCRQPVFRSFAEDITKPGVHKWQANAAASSIHTCLQPDWQNEFLAETRVQ